MQENFQEFGYTSSDPVQNLEIIFLFMVCLMLLPIIVKFAELMSFWNDTAVQALRRFKETNLYWNYYLRFGIQAYLEIALSSLFRIKSYKFDTIGDTVLSLFACLLFAALLGYPLGSYIFLRNKF